MNEAGRPALDAVPRADPAPHRSRLSGLIWIALPLVALALAALTLVLWDPLRSFDTGAPPVEKLTFERTVLDGQGIHVKVRAGGSKPMTIAQVQVDEAFWSFRQEPPGDLARVAAAWLHIPYPWVQAEAHKVRVITKTGVAFEHEIPVAVATPRPGASQLFTQALLGAFVGIVPVAIGLMFYPVMRGVGRRGLGFILALTVGLLGFLLIGTLEEALEIAGRTAVAFQGKAMVLLAAAVTFLVLIAVGRRHGTPTGLALATYIALGIGLHNLGEGLAIGAAFATGAAGLGAFLVFGFTLHNITEGVGIAAPLIEKRPSNATFVGLALLAGAPAIFGLWLGSLAYSPQWAALALAVGAGAILQVVVEVGAYLVRTADRSGANWLSAETVGGLAAGVAVMYATGMLVKV